MAPFGRDLLSPRVRPSDVALAWREGTTKARQLQAEANDESCNLTHCGSSHPYFVFPSRWSKRSVR
jgi:hypothetical protein